MNGSEDVEGETEEFETIRLDESPPVAHKQQQNVESEDDNFIPLEPSLRGVAHTQPMLIPARVPVVTKEVKPRQAAPKSDQSYRPPSPSSVISELTLLIKPEFLGILDTLTPQSPLIAMQSASTAR